MATRNSTGAPRGNRSTKTPALAVVTADTKPRRIEFAHDDFSLLGSVPALAAEMPLMTYDPTLAAHRLAVDEHAKGEVLERIGNSRYAVTCAIKLIGMLMAGQNREFGYIGDDEIADLGFTLHGLAHMAEQLGEAAERIAEATPTEDREARHV